MNFLIVHRAAYAVDGIINGYLKRALHSKPKRKRAGKSRSEDIARPVECNVDILIEMLEIFTCFRVVSNGTLMLPVINDTSDDGCGTAKGCETT